MTLVAVLGGVGVLPGGGADARRRLAGQRRGRGGSRGRGRPVRTGTPVGRRRPRPRRRRSASRRGARPRTSRRPRASRPAAAPAAGWCSTMGDQRVWLVGRHDGAVPTRTYLVSGSVTDNLAPRHATPSTPGRCTRSASTTPARCGTSSGSPRATTPPSASTTSRCSTASWCRRRDELGTPQSHGCIRQWRARRRRAVGTSPRSAPGSSSSPDPPAGLSGLRGCRFTGDAGKHGIPRETTPWGAPESRHHLVNRQGIPPRSVGRARGGLAAATTTPAGAVAGRLVAGLGAVLLRGGGGRRRCCRGGGVALDGAGRCGYGCGHGRDAGRSSPERRRDPPRPPEDAAGAAARGRPARAVGAGGRPLERPLVPGAMPWSWKKCSEVEYVSAARRTAGRAPC